MYKKKCLWCFKEFETEKRFTKFCRNTCKRKHAIMKKLQKYHENKGELYIHIMNTSKNREALMKLYKDDRLVSSILSASKESETIYETSIDVKFNLILRICVCVECTIELRKRYNNDPRFFVMLPLNTSNMEEQAYIIPDERNWVL